MNLGLAVQTKSAEDIRAKLDELITLLLDARAALARSPSSIDLRCKAAVLDNEIERRRLFLASLLNRTAGAG